MLGPLIVCACVLQGVVIEEVRWRWVLPGGANRQASEQVHVSHVEGRPGAVRRRSLGDLLSHRVHVCVFAAAAAAAATCEHRRRASASPAGVCTRPPPMVHEALEDAFYITSATSSPISTSAGRARNRRACAQFAQIDLDDFYPFVLASIWCRQAVLETMNGVLVSRSTGRPHSTDPFRARAMDVSLAAAVAVVDEALRGATSPPRRSLRSLRLAQRYTHIHTHPSAVNHI